MSAHLSVDVEEVGDARRVTVVFTPTPPAVEEVDELDVYGNPRR